MTETTEANGPVTLAKIFVADDKGTPVADAVGQRVKEQNASRWEKFLLKSMKEKLSSEMALLMGGSISDVLGDAFLSVVTSKVERRMDSLWSLDLEGALHEWEKLRSMWQESAEFTLEDFGLDPKQRVTWKQKHTISLQGLVWNVRELEFEIDFALEFSGARVGLNEGYVHSICLGVCNLGDSTFAWKLNGADMGTYYPAEDNLTLPEIQFPQRKRLLPDELVAAPKPVPIASRPHPSGDRRERVRRSRTRRVRVRRVSNVAVEVERRTAAAARREAERRALSGGERRTVTRRIGERRVSTDLRQGERHMVTRPPLPTSRGRVDVNRADVEVLQSLPGVGPTLAERIIAERQKRLFTSQDELARVQGLGAAMVERLRPHITAGGGS